MRRVKRNVVPLLLFAVAFLVGLHQFVVWGYWFEWSDIHHESFVIALAFAGLVSLWLLNLKGRRR